ncbi:MAG: GNAT family N-acetyltransferase [Henriciella sp.]
MIEFASANYSDVAKARLAYLKTLASPLDGMWEDAFFAGGQHWHIKIGGDAVGYCGTNEQNALLGFQVFDPHASEPCFQACMDRFAFKQAFVSTVEPAYFSHCLDRQTSLKVNALMYEDDGTDAMPGQFSDGMEFRVVEQTEIETAIAFALDAIGANRAWLEGYYAERIAKKELFGVWRGDEMIGAGELRVSPSQPGVADVGMIVAPVARKAGLATQILQQLRHDGQKRGYRLVCSTEMENVPAQKAIARAGFHSRHRILEMGLQGGS